jgi:excisionase family DNA binding protein
VAVQLASDSGPSGAALTPLACAVFASMLRVPLRRRTSSASGIHPDNAAELRAAYEELDRVGREWMSWQRPISVAALAAVPATEMARDSVGDMITTEIASQMLRLSDSRIRQLLRSGELPGRKVGRRWLVKRSAVAAYAGSSRKAAA